MALLPFRLREPGAPDPTDRLAPLFADYSIEVTPRTAARIEDFRALLPAGTRVYVAHIDGTPITQMVATAARLAGQGFEVMPHVPARLVPDLPTLEDWIARYQGEAGVSGALLMAGGLARPLGDFHCTLQLLESGAFDRAGFRRLHVAGHPEGNLDIDPDGSDRGVMEALRRKQAFAAQTDARMAIVTQFGFDAAPVLAWARRLRAEGILLPIHLGVAGPAKLQTLIKFAVACGVGPSIKVLQKRVLDIGRLMLPYEPTEMLEQIAAEAEPGLIAGLHLFPLGGLCAAAGFASRHGGPTPVPTAARIGG
ncbi:methylenetetrahydrofolate reductase [Oceanicola sp. S124]|uniref:methylenetetrahydrofolate reductase n=1 Tax=Oceanicola sp. S124 TaxID=1042378 RepID=UPI00025593F8|nr:methylenetetrahydrofolate reductase [Oceanicola sp. S124]